MSLLDWIYPPKCIACKMLLPLMHNAPKQRICKQCMPLFVAIEEPFCKVCGHPGLPCPSCYGKTFHFEYNRAIFRYEDTVRDLIHKMKFQGQKQAAYALGDLIAKNLNFTGNYIIPVPLHKSKKRSRGFNQATVLAKPLSKALNIPISENLLLRVKNTMPQSQLNSHAREDNLTDAFAYNKKKYKTPPDTLILIDDIFTSGATMNACAKVLKNNGVKQVICVSLSIALKEVDQA